MRLVRNWLSAKPSPQSTTVALVVALFLVFIAQAAWFWPNFAEQLPVSGHAVFVDGEWWRLWTACFAHADLGHLLSNLLFLVIFGRFVGGHFGWIAFPVLPFILGGVANLSVLRTYPDDVSILGASGVVNVVGGMWLALFYMLSRQYRQSGRLLRAFGVGLLLFAPQEFRPNVAEKVHLAGLVIGVGAGLIWFLAQRKAFRAAEVWEAEPVVLDEIETLDEFDE